MDEYQMENTKADILKQKEETEDAAENQPAPAPVPVPGKALPRLSNFRGSCGRWRILLSLFLTLSVAVIFIGVHLHQEGTKSDKLNSVTSKTDPLVNLEGSDLPPLSGSRDQHVYHHAPPTGKEVFTEWSQWGHCVSKRTRSCISTSFKSCKGETVQYDAMQCNDKEYQSMSGTDLDLHQMQAPKRETEKEIVQTAYTEVGCFCDNYCGENQQSMRQSVRAISGKITFYTPPDIAVKKCYERAKESGFSHFAVQYNNECFTSMDAGTTYHKFGGKTTGCKNGRGASWKNTVYKIKDKEA